MPSVKVVNGKQIVVEALDPGQRFKRFLAKPLLQMRYNREIILAILRRELASRFTGSAGGWLWAVAAPLFAIAVYTFAFTTKLQMTFVGEQGQAPITYALFIFAGLIVFNFFSEMAYRSPMLLHEYAHFIKQTIFPSDMLAVISTPATGMPLMLTARAVKDGLPWTVSFPLVFLPLMAFLVSWFLCASAPHARWLPDDQRGAVVHVRHLFSAHAVGAVQRHLYPTRSPPASRTRGCRADGRCAAGLRGAGTLSSPLFRLLVLRQVRNVIVDVI
jgi:lipopolysaccharide transport system permease protein